MRHRSVLRHVVLALIAFGSVAVPSRAQNNAKPAAPQKSSRDTDENNASPKFRSGRLPCAQIVREVDRQRVRQPHRLVETADVGRVLDQDQRWVERCMHLYGRRPLKPAPVHIESKEEEEEIWESGEGEEVGREETGDGRGPFERSEKRHDPKYRPPTPVRQEE